jgi:hypothetical protein
LPGFRSYSDGLAIAQAKQDCAERHVREIGLVVESQWFQNACLPVHKVDKTVGTSRTEILLADTDSDLSSLRYQTRDAVAYLRSFQDSIDQIWKVVRTERRMALEGLFQVGSEVRM